jgi:hypothetical protein
MKRINNCTLICADTYNYGGAVASLKKCMAQCEFDRVVFFTNIPLKLDGIDVIQIEDLKGKDGYSHFMLKEMHKYISTDFVLTVQHDSWILDGNLFDERLYDVDWAGALWLENDGLANGNGGFSWRSRFLMEAVAKDSLINATSPEDVCVCRVYRRYLEKNYNLVWASDEVCEQFSFELRTPAQPTFGFHSFFHKPYQKTVVIKRAAALGDVVQVEPVLKYFHDKGYRVVLDTLPQFQLLFLNHYFKVHTLNEVDQRLLETAKFVNLDMSYESNPKQLHLKTYFEYAGVPEEEYSDYIKSPQLNLGFALNKDNKLFKKYAVIHTDNRSQGGRRIHGVNWEEVVEFLIANEYTPIQVGRDDTATIKNAIQINCTNENFLCYVVGGADLMLGVDSGISHIASGFKVPSVICFGSVDPEVIHPDLSDKVIIHNHDKKPCESKYCWGSVIGTEGAKCYLAEQLPPCSIFTSEQIINGIKQIWK